MAKVEDCAKGLVSILKEVVINIEDDGTNFPNQNEDKVIFKVFKNMYIMVLCL